MADECLFCRIAKGEIPSKVVREDEQIYAFRDIDPKAPTHVLIIPRRHIASVNDLGESDGDIIGRLFLAAREIAAAEGLAKGGYRLVMNNGPDAGQSVSHIHLHVLGGRRMSWPPG
ncbi:MAG: histidine triad nucleotide-binding protein [Longimicrobiales bacterium]